MVAKWHREPLYLADVRIDRDFPLDCTSLECDSDSIFLVQKVYTLEQEKYNCTMQPRPWKTLPLFPILQFPTTNLHTRSTQPMTKDVSSGKSYSGTSKFNGAGPFLILPEIS